MSEVIRLKHQYRSNMPLRVQYFYDGRAEVKYGVIELPVDKPAWIDRAFMIGFRCDPESGRVLTLLEVRALARGDSAESTGETDEGSDGGRQPADEDGVRSSEQPRGEGLLVPVVASGVGDGAAEGTVGGSPVVVEVDTVRAILDGPNGDAQDD